MDSSVGGKGLIPAAIYARVSTSTQAEHGTSLGSQVESMEKWAKSKGYEPRHVLREDWTGTQIDRPALDEAKRLAEDGRISALLVYSWDRLGRDMTHQHVLRYLFEEEWSVKLICVTEPEMDELSSQIYRTAISMSSEIENYFRRERTTRGRHEMVKLTGRLPAGGGNVFGYDYLPKSKGGDGTRTINVREAKVVRLIFRWFVEDRLSLSAICRRLESRAVPTKTGRSRWDPSTVRGILRNPAYSGRTYAYRWRTVVPEKPQMLHRKRKRSRVRLQSSEEWIRLPDGVSPRIVSDELWQAAQERCKSRYRNVRAKSHYRYILSGFLYCEACGGEFRMWGESAIGVARNHYYYRCGRPRRSGSRCGHRQRAVPLEDLVWEAIRERLSNPDLIRQEVQSFLNENPGSLVQDVQEAESALAQLRTEERRLLRLYAAGKASEQLLDDELARIRTEVAGWEESRERAQTDRDRLEKLETDLANLESHVEHWVASLDDASPEHKRDIFEVLGLRITVDREGQVSIRGRIPMSRPGVRAIGETSRIRPPPSQGTSRHTGSRWRGVTTRDGILSVRVPIYA